MASGNSNAGTSQKGDAVVVAVVVASMSKWEWQGNHLYYTLSRAIGNRNAIIYYLSWKCVPTRTPPSHLRPAPALPATTSSITFYSIYINYYYNSYNTFISPLSPQSRTLLPRNEMLHFM